MKELLVLVRPERKSARPQLDNRMIKIVEEDFRKIR
jgi:hypothetical protein